MPSAKPIAGFVQCERDPITAPGFERFWTLVTAPMRQIQHPVSHARHLPVGRDVAQPSDEMDDGLIGKKRQIEHCGPEYLERSSQRRGVEYQRKGIVAALIERQFGPDTA